MNKEDEKRFSQMNTIISSGNEDELKFFIDNNQDLLKVDPILFISNHVMFYALKEQPSNVLSVIEHYKNAPYISMEVEEFLNELKEKMLKAYETKEKKFDESKLRPYLLSKTEGKIIRALNYLSTVNIRMHLDLVREFLLKEDISYKYKTLALFMLVEQKVDSVFEIYKDDGKFSINPINLKLPFDNDLYIDAKNYLKKVCPPSYYDETLEIFNSIHIRTYPDSILEEYNSNLVVDVCVDITRGLYQEDPHTQEIKQRYNIDEMDLYDIESRIQDILTN
jgi:hypothetical protein